MTTGLSVDEFTILLALLKFPFFFKESAFGANQNDLLLFDLNHKRRD
jgi:hypothetical protein